MTVYYVDGSNGNDSWNGTSPIFTSGSTGPKKTLTAIEAVVAAGDLVHVRAGAYRETLNTTAAGTAGNQIEYRGDYIGAVWRGAGGVVRITGSDNDTQPARANCILVNTDYRKFTNFLFDSCTGELVYANLGGVGGATGLTISGCYFAQHVNAYALAIVAISAPATQVTIEKCLFTCRSTQASGRAIFLTSGTVITSNIVVQGCVFLAAQTGVSIVRVGGLVVKGCLFMQGTYGVAVSTNAPTGSITVTQCTFGPAISSALLSTATLEIIEDYNNFDNNFTPRTNVAVGAHSLTILNHFDASPWFEIVAGGAGPNNPRQVISMFDLSQWSLLVDRANSGAYSTDARGTGVIGAAMAWGPLEYDETLQKSGRAAKRIISPAL